MMSVVTMTMVMMSVATVSGGSFMMTMVMMSVVPMSLIVLMMWAVMMAPTTAMAATTTTTCFSARKCRGASCRDAALAPEKGASEAAARQRQ